MQDISLLSFSFHIHLLRLDCPYALMIAGTGLTLSLVSGALSHLVPLKSGLPNPPAGTSSLNNPLTPSSPSTPPTFSPLNLLLRILLTASWEIPNLRERKAREKRSGSRVCRARRPAMAENVSFLVGCHGPRGLCATASDKLEVCGVRCGGGGAGVDGGGGGVCTGCGGGRSKGRYLAFFVLGAFGWASTTLASSSFDALFPNTSLLPLLELSENLSFGGSCLQDPTEDELKPRETPGHSKHTVLCNLDPSDDEAARHEAIVNEVFLGRCMKRMYVEILNGEDEEWRFCIPLFFFLLSFFFYDDFRRY